MRRIVEQMETPELIRQLVGMLPNVPAEHLPEIERNLKLSYYFGGQTVLKRDTPDGLEILASGPVEEVVPVLWTLSEEERAEWVLSFPDPFEEYTADFLPPPVAASALAG